MLYTVHVTQDWRYEVEADSPEEAQSNFEYDQGCYKGNCTGYSIEAVTTPDGDAAEVDLRAPIPCHGGCGKLLPASSFGECIGCFKDRMMRMEDRRSAMLPQQLRYRKEQ